MELDSFDLDTVLQDRNNFSGVEIFQLSEDVGESKVLVVGVVGSSHCRQKGFRFLQLNNITDNGCGGVRLKDRCPKNPDQVCADVVVGCRSILYGIYDNEWHC